jgi:serine protease Do
MRIAGSCFKGAVMASCLAAALMLMSPRVWAQPDRIGRTVQISVDGAYLGIGMEEVTSDNLAKYKLSNERGVIVRSVEKGSPAQDAGLQENDVILEFAGTPVLSTVQFARLVQEMPVGRKVDLVVSRDGKKLDLTAKLKEREGTAASGNRRARIFPRDGSSEDYFYRFNGPLGRSFEFRTPEGKRPFILSIPDDLREDNLPAGRPRLGITMQSLTSQLAEFLGVPGKKGALVTSVSEGTPAAGRLRAGDVIVRANEKLVESPEDVAKIVRELDGDAKLDFKVVRDRKEISIAVQLPKMEEKSKSGGYKM